MRKNILVAGLLSLCVIGMTGCSKGDENKADEPTAPATAMAQPEQNQVAPAQQTADNSSLNSQSNPSQPQANQVVADSSTTTTTTPSTGTDSTTTTTAPTTGTDSTTTTTTTPTTGDSTTTTTTPTTGSASSDSSATTTTTTQSN